MDAEEASFSTSIFSISSELIVEISAPATPSTTINGEVLPLIVLIPRIFIEYPPPGLLLFLTMASPGTCPCNALITFSLPDLVSCLLSIEEMEPAKSERFIVP